MARSGSKERKANGLACGARLAIRRYRNLGESHDLQRHEEQKAELMALIPDAPQFGVWGWDDACTSPDRSEETRRAMARA